MQDTIKHAILRHNGQVPRYTSYPPANFFSKSPPHDLLAQWVRALPSDAGVSLYFHIPFCPKMCWFCGCHTRATTRYTPVTDYLDLLYREIDMVSALYGAQRTVRHIHFGGGSPTMLEPDDFTALMDKIRSRFNLIPDCQIAVEMDPRQITPEKVVAYAKSGVTRASMGVQDIHDKVMKAINRVQPFSLVEKAVALCRQHGINHINIDLVYGLPHQTVDGMVETVQHVLTLCPDRLAVFGYAHVPWMKKHMRLMPEEDLPGPELRYDLFMTAAATLEDNGYIAIGIDHFARADDELARSLAHGTLARNFQGYIPQSENMPIIGLGASAISELPNGYIQNLAEVVQYRDSLLDGQHPASRYHALSEDDHLRSRIIEQLMCDQMLVPSSFGDYELAVLAIIDENRAQIQTLGQDGLASIDSKGVITVHSPLAVRMVAALFDAYRLPQSDGAQAAPKRHVAAV